MAGIFMTGNKEIRERLLQWLWPLLIFVMLCGGSGLAAAKASPAVAVSSHPVLSWAGYPDAVMYEFQIAPTKAFADSELLLKTTEVFTAGYQPDLSRWLGRTLYYRVRPLDYGRQPLAAWSSAVAIKVAYPEDFSKFQPRITSRWSKVTPILYPVYSWIPVVGADTYQVELFAVNKSAAPKSPKRYRLLRTFAVAGSLSFDCYDDSPRVGDYAWRVRALNKDGQPIGGFSDLDEFSLTAVPGKFALGVFGDSIMHGGGAISGSPSDFCYSLHAYLAVPAVNLAKSGDTAETSLLRFDQDVAPFAPRTLLILAGTNSIRGGEKAEKVTGELTAIYNKCKENRIFPVFLTLPPINPGRIALVFKEESAEGWQEERQKVNQYIRTNFPHIDIAPLFTDLDGTMPVKWATDGLHPDSKAKKLIADMVNHSQFLSGSSTRTPAK